MISIKRFVISIFLFLPTLLIAQDGFPLPDVPKTLKGPEVRANYLALHYWDNIDFNNGIIFKTESLILNS